MTKQRIHRLGDLQLRIMQVLWERQQATVGEVHAAVAGERNLAYTTIATMLRKMEERALVGHRLHGRSFVYHATVPADAVSRGMAGHLLDGLFEGSLADMVQHLITTRDVSAEELARIEKLVATKRRKK